MLVSEICKLQQVIGVSYTVIQRFVAAYPVLLSSFLALLKTRCDVSVKAPTGACMRFLCVSE